MVDLAHLADIEEIRQLKARYFRALDTQNWPEFRAVFTDDAVIGPIENGFPAEILALRPAGARQPITSASVDSFVERVAANSKGRITTHHGHQAEIEITGKDEASGIWAMEDILVWPEDGYRLRGTGHYWEMYRRSDGVWKICSLKLTRLYVYAERIEPTAWSTRGSRERYL